MVMSPLRMKYDGLSVCETVIMSRKSGRQLAA